MRLRTRFSNHLRFSYQFVPDSVFAIDNVIAAAPCDYDATLGRYTQSDPIGLAGGLNTFGYVDSSPLTAIDPSGLSTLNAYCLRRPDECLEIGLDVIQSNAQLAQNAVQANQACMPNAASANSGSVTDPVLQVTVVVAAVAGAIRVVKGKPDPQVIKQIVRLPNNAQLNANQIAQLTNNLNVLLTKTLPAKVRSGKVQNLIDVLNNDPRFRFIDQIPGGRQRIIDAFAKYGLKWG